MTIGTFNVSMKDALLVLVCVRRRRTGLFLVLDSVLPQKFATDRSVNAAGSPVLRSPILF
jgi:hypothetical protein